MGLLGCVGRVALGVRVVWIGSTATPIVPPDSRPVKATASAARERARAPMRADGDAILPGAGGARRRSDGGQKETRMGRTVMVQWVEGMKAEAAVGSHRVVLDAPPEAGGTDEGLSPAEMLLSAIGA